MERNKDARAIPPAGASAQAKEAILNGYEKGNAADPFFDAFVRLGPKLLLDPELNALVEEWWFVAKTLTFRKQSKMLPSRIFSVWERR